MKFEPTLLKDGTLQILVTISKEEVDTLDKGPFDKTDYCVTCKNQSKYTIQTYGDFLANIEAAATCIKNAGDPSYSLRNGAC